MAAYSDVLKADASFAKRRRNSQTCEGRSIRMSARHCSIPVVSGAGWVAQSSVNLADEALTQSRDRFTAGVTANLEVVQAQESVATANENYIASLYAHNLAKVSFARAIGRAEEGVLEYLKGK